MISAMDRGFYNDINQQQNSQNTQKIIISFNDVDRNLTITIQEFRALLGYYSYGNAHKICFAIMGCAGLRAAEVCKLTLDSFIKADCSEFKYVVAKTKPKKYKDSGTIVYNHKVRKASLPAWLAQEVLWYISNNYHVFQERELFGFDAHTLRRYLGDLRERARQNKIQDPVLIHALLDTSSDRFILGCKSHENKYRFTLHSLRRLYLTLKYNTDFEKDLVRTQRDIGHELKETTMKYLHNPEQIGLSSELQQKKKIFENILFDKSQTRIDEF